MKRSYPESKQDKKKEVEYFDKYIENYSEYDLWGEETYGWILDQLDLTTKSRALKILDLGCGTGVWSERLASLGHFVYGIDISQKMIQVAAKKGRVDGSRFSVALGDIEALPFGSGKFDVCFVGGVLHHFPSVSAALEQVSRVVKPGGRVYLLEPNGSNPIMRLSYLLRLLLDPFTHSSGRYASINEQTFTTGFYEKHCRRYWRSMKLVFFQVNMSSDPSHQGWFLVAITLRNYMMKLLQKLLPPRYGCNYVILIAE